MGEKDVLVYEREHGRKLFLVAVDLRNQVGALSDVTSRVEKLKVNILVGFFSSAKTDDVGRCSFFGAATSSRTTADQLKSVLSESEFVKGCEVKEAHRGLLVDSLNFPLEWNSGDKAIMLRTEFFTMMKDKINQIMGSGADTVLYELGYDHGFPSWKNILTDYDVRTLEDLDEVMQFYTAVGWGKTKAVSFDPASKTATVQMHDTFECSGQSKPDPTSHFVRGHLAGAFSNIFKGRAEIEETSCIACGDEYCEFEVSGA